jgi:hypothetical protein
MEVTPLLLQLTKYGFIWSPAPIFVFPTGRQFYDNKKRTGSVILMGALRYWERYVTGSVVLMGALS